MSYDRYVRHQEGGQVNFLARVFGWMTAGLSLSALSAYMVVTTPAIYSVLFGYPFVLMALLLFQLGLVVVLSSLINRMSLLVAVVLFGVYSVSVGATLSSVLLIYTLSSIFATLAVTAGMFGAMAIYGAVTKVDLSSMGSYLLMGLFGLIIGTFVNYFLRSEGISYMLSYAGVVIFTLLTAYDVQKIKQMASSSFGDRQTTSKLALLGALTLYLDFVNLFLYLLRIMGKRKD